MPSVSEKQRRFFALIHAANKAGKKLTGKAGEVQSNMSKEDVKHFTKMDKSASSNWLSEAIFNLKQHEGWSSRPYIDKKSDKPNISIGYGFNTDELSTLKSLKRYGWSKGSDLSLYQGNKVLNELIRNVYLPTLNKKYRNFNQFSDNRKTALLDMIYNLGETKFNRFEKMHKAIRKNDWDVAAQEAFDSKWRKQIGVNRSSYVVNRLKDDAQYIKDGPNSLLYQQLKYKYDKDTDPNSANDIVPSKSNSYKVNRGKFITHYVAPGDTLSAIGQRYKTPVKTLQILNKISNPNKIRAGDIIRIPMNKKGSVLNQNELDLSRLINKLMKKADMVKSLKSVLDQIYQENPSYFPNGLSFSNYSGDNDILSPIFGPNHKVIGFKGIQVRDKKPYLTVGVLKDYRGKGYAYASIKKLIDDDSKGNKQIQYNWVYKSGNIPSKLLAEKLKSDGYNINISENFSTLKKQAAFPFIPLGLMALGIGAEVGTEIRDQKKVIQLDNDLFNNTLTTTDKENIKNLWEIDNLRKTYGNDLLNGHTNTFNSKDPVQRSMIRSIEKEIRDIKEKNRITQRNKEYGEVLAYPLNLADRVWGWGKNLALYTGGNVYDKLTTGVSINPVTGENRSILRSLTDLGSQSSYVIGTKPLVTAPVKGVAESIAKQSIPPAVKGSVLPASLVGIDAYVQHQSSREDLSQNNKSESETNTNIGSDNFREGSSVWKEQLNTDFGKLFTKDFMGKTALTLGSILLLNHYVRKWYEQDKDDDYGRATIIA